MCIYNTCYNRIAVCANVDRIGKPNACTEKIIKSTNASPISLNCQQSSPMSSDILDRHLGIIINAIDKVPKLIEQQGFDLIHTPMVYHFFPDDDPLDRIKSTSTTSKLDKTLGKVKGFSHNVTTCLRERYEDHLTARADSKRALAKADDSHKLMRQRLRKASLDKRLSAANTPPSEVVSEEYLELSSRKLIRHSISSNGDESFENILPEFREGRRALVSWGIDFDETIPADILETQYRRKGE